MSDVSFSLLELNRLVKSTIESRFDSPVWLVAEINSITNHRSGHCYLEFIQKAKDSDQIIAQARATIWSTQYRMLSSYFQSVTNTSLSKGIKILVKVSIDFHELYGLSLNVRDIDPNYTLGDLERRKKEIIEKLNSEGIIDMNKSLELPEVIQKVAVISSPGAAGYEDFMNQIDSNKYGYSFDIQLFEADMQGANTENSVVNALNLIFDNDIEFDVITIIRGGGSKSDLSAFDNYNIAFHITQIPIPVISGIGHERDDSITDLVSHTKIKTPTAVANFVIDHNLKFETEMIILGDEIVENVKDYIRTQEMYLTGLGFELNKTKDILSKKYDNCNEIYYRLKNATKNSILEKKVQLDKSKQRLSREPNILIDNQISSLDSIMKQIKTHKVHILEKEFNRFESVEHRLRLTDPKNVLKRGFSITKANGKVLTKKTNIKEGDEMETVMFDKKILSKVTKSTRI